MRRPRNTKTPMKSADSATPIVDIVLSRSSKASIIAARPDTAARRITDGGFRIFFVPVLFEGKTTSPLSHSTGS